jgi:hypothetical protein
MRGLSKQEESRKLYYGVANGYIVKRVKEETANSRPRTLEKGANAGKVVFEEYYPAITGQIIGLEVKESEFGKQLLISLDTSLDYTETSNIQMPLSSPYAKRFLFALPNINLQLDVTLLPYKFTPKGNEKEQVGISVKQEGVKVQPAFTKENPNGLPPLDKIKVKGKETWDDSSQLEFLEQLINSINPAPAPVPQQSVEVDLPTTESEDLPF